MITMQVKLTVMMTSANGVFVAGSANVLVSLNGNSSQSQVLLEKCPDRDASIILKQTCRLLSRDVADPNADEDSIHLPTTMNLGTFGGGRTTKLQSSNYSSANDVLVRSRGDNRLPTKIPSPQIVRHRETVLRQGNERMKTGVNMSNYGNLRSVNSPPQMSWQTAGQTRTSQIYQQDYGGSSNAETAFYVKEIARLKSDLKQLQSDDKWDEINRVKDELEMQTKEFQKLKERLQDKERKERDYLSLIKELKEEKERHKIKHQQLEGVKNDYEAVVSQRELTIREIQQELKKADQRQQDLLLAQTTQQKRLEFKEASYQEQLKKAADRYVAAEGERQKLTLDFNNLMARMEEAEKKYLLSSKEKDRAYADQKCKLGKRVEVLVGTVEQLKNDLNERDSTIGEQTAQLKAVQRKEQEQEERLSKVESALEIANLQLRKEIEQRKSFEAEIEMCRTIIEERNSLKKKAQENSAELGRLQDKLLKANQDLESTTAALKKAGKSLADVLGDKQTLHAKYNSLTRELEAYRNQEDKRIRETETLSAQNFNAGQRISDLKGRLQSERREFEEMQAIYEEKLAYATKARDYANNELEEMRWSIEKSAEQAEKQGQRLKETNAEILRLSQLSMQQADRIRRLQEEAKESRGSFESLTQTCQLHRRKEREYVQQLREKSEQVYEQQRKQQQSEQQQYLLNEKHRQLQAAFRKTVETSEKESKERDKILACRNEEIGKMVTELAGKNAEVARLTQEGNAKATEIATLKCSLQQLKAELANKDGKLEDSCSEARRQAGDLEALKKDLAKSRKQLEEETRGTARTRSEWQEYRQATAKALEQLLEEIGRDEEGKNIRKTLLPFPDINLSAMQMEAIKRRNSLLAGYNEQLQTLNTINRQLEEEVKKIKKALVAQEQSSELLLKNNQDKHRQIVAEISREKEELLAECQQLEERVAALLAEIEKAKIVTKRKEDAAEQLHLQIKNLSFEKEALQTNLKVAEETIVAFKANQTKRQQSNESKLATLSEQSNAYLQKQQSTIAQLEKKLGAAERSMKEKDEAAKRLEQKINQLTYEKEREQRKASELERVQQTLGEERQEWERKYKIADKNFKETSQQLSLVNETAMVQKLKLDEMTSKQNQTNRQLSESQVNCEKLKQELQSSQQRVEKLEGALKETTLRHKQAQQRQQQQCKTLQEKIITLNSETELKSFLVGQLQEQKCALESNLADFCEELQKKKTEITRLSEKVQLLKNSELYASQTIDTLKVEKEFLEAENEKNKQKASAFQEEALHLSQEVEQLDAKEREITKLKQELETARANSERDIRNTRVAPLSARGESRLLQESRSMELLAEKRLQKHEFQREKQLLLEEIDQLVEQKNNLQAEFDFQRAQFTKEIELLVLEGEQLRRALSERNGRQTERDGREDQFGNSNQLGPMINSQSLLGETQDGQLAMSQEKHLVIQQDRVFE